MLATFDKLPECRIFSINNALTTDWLVALLGAGSEKMRQAKLWSLVLGASFLGGVAPAWALPPAEDVPEEVLRTEIITVGRSPIDGQLLTAAEYAQLRSQLAEGRFAPEVDPKFQQLIFLLRLRRLIKTIVPIAPF